MNKDVVEVVRCKDCLNRSDCSVPNEEFCEWHKSYVKGNDFCSHGKKADYISKLDAFKIASKYICSSTDQSIEESLRRDLKKAQCADVEPVVHAEWLHEEAYKYKCSNCLKVTDVDEVMCEPAYIRCPYCGAKMDLE